MERENMHYLKILVKSLNALQRVSEVTHSFLGFSTQFFTKQYQMCRCVYLVNLRAHNYV